ncbi:carcinoembryonic antigen-related cell adhesion molecule 7-like isoform X2 [Dendropsophus ebraccatus]|uniref:carcinoembryonic antigen-related cell adhesion molecule 7-like isoform X2 n=1 Tax=Dendropsophus ebraccatus TaxID=150705 RepID=UPI0038317EA7
MDGRATLLWALNLLLLVYTGRKAAAITVQSDSSTNYLVGKNITLSITYTSIKTPDVSWAKDGVQVATFIKGFADELDVNKQKIIGNGSLLIYNSTKSDSGNYTVSVSALGEATGTLTFPVQVYDPVTNVLVSQSPATVDESTPAVSLTCSAATGAVTYTWTRNETQLPSNSSYVTLDGGKTLQIKLPNRTFTGNYTCKVSNPVDSASASYVLNVLYSDSLSGGAIAGIVIGSVFGALLLIALIVLVVFCIRKRRKEKEKKVDLNHKEAIRTVSGTTLSPDDPAFFTMNNIMYRSSSISMGSYIMNNGDNTSDYVRNPSPIPPPSQPKIKKATQV